MLKKSFFLLALALSGCIAKKNGDITGSIRPQTAKSEQQWRGEVTQFAALYQANPQDRNIALGYGRALRHTGQTEQAVAVLQRAAVVSKSNDHELLGEFGRALADDRKFEQALDVLSRSHTPERPDWRILNVQGTVYDQMGQFQQAHNSYNLALKIAPNDAGVLSNLGLSHALSGNLKHGELLLRQAASTGNDAKIRQNLALVIGLQGRFAEAETLVKQDQTPEQAESNVQMLKAMLGQTKASQQKHPKKQG